MEREELKKYMPHREPMLLVDRSEMVEENHVVSEYTVTGEEAFVQGHFPGNPIVPGVCLIETARVAAETILGKSLETLIVTNCRFRRPVMASEQAAVKIKLQKLEETRWKVKADIRVGSDICAQLQLKAAVL